MPQTAEKGGTHKIHPGKPKDLKAEKAYISIYQETARVSPDIRTLQHEQPPPLGIKKGLQLLSIKYVIGRAWQQPSIKKTSMTPAF